MKNDEKSSDSTNKKIKKTQSSEPRQCSSDPNKTERSPREWLRSEIPSLNLQATKFKEVKDEIETLFTRYIQKRCEPVIEKYETSVCLFLWIKEALNSHHLEELHNSFKQNNEKNIYLFLDSGGGRIEPAFQISKLCHKYAKNFFVVVPRQAKSAATLLALGAKKIYMGGLSELGPIDPQIGGLPALGLQEAIETLLKMAAKNPQSVQVVSDVLTRHLNMQVLGWMTRLPKSAVQYAEKLLALNHKNKEEVTKIANKLVYGYKDHSFVIDSDEAKNIFANLSNKTNENSEKVSCDKTSSNSEGIIYFDDILLSAAEEIHHEVSRFEWYINQVYQQPDFRLQLNIIGLRALLNRVTSKRKNFS